MEAANPAPLVTIACGGTGGHLFPGMAVAAALLERGADAQLLVSPKEVDQQAVRQAAGLEVHTLPAVALERGRLAEFAAGFWRGFWAARAVFRRRQPVAILAMGGFTSAPAVVAARLGGARVFLHEANSIPGRANRWLATLATEAFVYFPRAARRWRVARVSVSGMPVRSQFQGLDPEACRMALGLRPRAPVLLITGGSQGAQAINERVQRLVPSLALLEPQLQFIHLTGPGDAERWRETYVREKRRAVVRPFLTEMELALGAATVAVSRAGASSLAEFAATRVPAILLPYPAAADNHQFHNARAFAESGAAILQEQAKTTPGSLLWTVRGLLRGEARRRTMVRALADWHQPDAATRLAEALLAVLPAGARPSVAEDGLPGARAGGLPVHRLAIRPG